MKKNIYILLLFSVTFAHGQSYEEYWDRWNSRYPETDIISVLKFERDYADSVRKNPDIVQYYLRQATYRFDAEYLGKTRKTRKEVIDSMKRVFKIFGGDPTQLDGLVKKDVLFRVKHEDIWMPIQPNVLKALKKEVKKGATVKLYCVFFNEHISENELYITFHISEFYY